MTDWLGSAAMALVKALARSDRQDVKRWSIVNGLGIARDDLANSGGERFENLDAMLADTLKCKVKPGVTYAERSPAGWWRGKRRTPLPLGGRLLTSFAMVSEPPGY